MMQKKTSSRTIVSLVACGIAGLSWSIPNAQEATDDLPGAQAVRRLVATRTVGGFVPPKTPWGDPDISGNFTNKDEANTPFERPEKWAGRSLEDITHEELAADIVERQQLAVERAPFAGGGEPEEGVAIAVPIHWFDNLAAVNARPWFVIDPSDGNVPMAVEAAPSPTDTLSREDRLRGGRRDSYTDRYLGDRCIAFGLWRNPAIYGNSYQILQTPEHVVLRYEMIHEARVIPVGSMPGPSDGDGFDRYMGDSRGFWDDNTLVVVTENINEAMSYRGGSAKNQRLIERFTRIGPDSVEWSVTIDDPTIWTAPWTYSIPLTEDDAQIIYEYACHEGNYGLANLLTAARAAEAP